MKTYLYIIILALFILLIVALEAFKMNQFKSHLDQEILHRTTLSQDALYSSFNEIITKQNEKVIHTLLQSPQLTQLARLNNLHSVLRTEPNELSYKGIIDQSGELLLQNSFDLSPSAKAKINNAIKNQVQNQDIIIVDDDKYNGLIIFIVPTLLGDEEVSYYIVYSGIFDLITNLLQEFNQNLQEFFYAENWEVIWNYNNFKGFSIFESDTKKPFLATEQTFTVHLRRHTYIYPISLKIMGNTIPTARLLWHFIFQSILTILAILAIAVLVKIYYRKTQKNTLYATQLIEHFPTPFCIVDLTTNKVIRHNANLFQQIQGITQEKNELYIEDIILGKSWYYLSSFLEELPYVVDHDIEIKSDTGQNYSLRISASQLTIEDKTLALISFANTKHDNSTELYLKHLAMTDPLTGLLNRRSFFEKVQTHLLNLEGDEEFVALSLDIDHFKSLNDAYGHQFGDIVLKEFATTLNRMIRKDYDIIARVGGEEFVIILLNTNYFSGKIIANRIRKTIHKMILTTDANEQVSISVSIGLEVVSKNKFSDIQELLNTVDRKLYSAKSNGRNRVET